MDAMQTPSGEPAYNPPPSASDVARGALSVVLHKIEQLEDSNRDLIVSSRCFRAALSGALDREQDMREALGKLCAKGEQIGGGQFVAIILTREEAAKLAEQVAAGYHPF
jgi:hypothetical protein